MAIKFISDSACDLKSNEHLTVLPLKVSFGTEDYLDNVTITRNKFYTELAKGEVFPKTSQVSPAQFEEAFKEAVSQGNDVICVTVSGALSGCLQSAMIAKEEVEGNIFVVDSESAAFGQGALIQIGIQMAQKGYSASEIVTHLNSIKKRLRVYAVIDTLEYLKKGGRVSATTAFAGDLLKIKPVISIIDGKVEVVAKARGRRGGMQQLNNFIEEKYNREEPIVFGYAKDNELLARYLENYKMTYGERFEDSQIGCAIGTHIGPQGYGVAFFE